MALGAILAAGLLATLGGPGGLVTTEPLVVPPTEPPDAGSDPTRRAGARSRRPGRITGAVRFARDARPAVDRTVRLDGGPAGFTEVLTDAFGAFRFDHLPTGHDYAVRVTEPGFAEVYLPGLSPRPGQGLDVGTLVLAPGVRVVVDVQTLDGRPLAGARVDAYRLVSPDAEFGQQDPVPNRTASTGADGRAALDGLASGEWAFTASKSRYARRGVTDVALATTDVERRVAIRLDAGYRLSGRVVDGQRQPIPSARVVAIRRSLSSDGSTMPLTQRRTANAEGRFAFDGIAATDTILWAGRPGAPLAVVAAVRVPDVLDVELVLPGGGTIRGKVTDAEGEALPGARVALEMYALRNFPFSMDSVTGRDGKYEIHLPVGGSLAGLSAERLGYQPKSDPRFEDMSFRTGPGLVIEADFELERGAIVKGQVTGPAGPLAGANVSAYDGSDLESTTTDRDGRYALGFHHAPRVVVFAHQEGYGHDGLLGLDEVSSLFSRGKIPAELELDLSTPGPHEHDLHLKATPAAAGTISGVVTVRDGTPVASAWVGAEGAQRVRTATDGAFVLSGAHTGSQREVVVEHPEYLEVRREVEVSATAPTIVPALVLTPRPRITGTVVGTDGAPAEGAYVQLAEDQLVGDGDPITEEWDWVEQDRYPVDAAGRFDIPAPRLNVSLYVRAGAAGLARARSGRIDIGDGTGRYEVVITLNRGHELRGTVTLDTGGPVPAANVVLLPLVPGGRPDWDAYPGAWGPPIAAVTAEDGTFLVPHLIEGRYRLRAFRVGCLPGEVTVRVPDDAHVALELTEARTIAGRVLSLDGKPVAGAVVTAHADDADSASAAYTRSSVDGEFLLERLHGGPHTVSAGANPVADVNIVTTEVPGVALGTGDVVIRVAPGLVIEGRVVLADGTAASGGYLEVAPEGGEALATNPEIEGGGRFRIIGLPSGSIVLTVRRVGNHEGLGSYQHDPVAAGTTGVEIRLPGKAALRVQMVDPSGAPLAGCHVRFRPVAINEIRTNLRDLTVQADEEGRISVDAPEGVSYRPQLQFGPNLVVVDSPLVVAGGAEMRVEAGAGVVLQGVVTGDGGKPVGGAEIYAQDIDEGFHRQTQAGPDGRFALGGLLPGNQCILTVRSQGYSPWTLHAIVYGKRELAVQLFHGLRTAGVVVDSAGHPVPGVPVALRLVEGGRSEAASTDDEGRFEVPELGPGTYRVLVAFPQDEGYVERGVLEAGQTDARVVVPVR